MENGRLKVAVVVSVAAVGTKVVMAITHLEEIIVVVITWVAN